MKYALKALLHLAAQDGAQVRTKDIAEQAMIPKKFLEQILLELKKGRIIASKQGNTGGYYFLKDPAEVTVADVYRIIDGPIALISCISKNFYEACDDCPDEATCTIRKTLLEVRDQTLAVMEKTTIADMMQ